MKPERWQQIERLYNAALERKPAERGAFLREACAGEEVVRREIESLLGYDEKAQQFIEAPAFEVAAKRMAEDRVNSMVGRQLGSYKILSQLGAGGMGEVYRARDSKLGREVAIKVLPAAFSRDADRLRRFEQEARAASSLNHPNIITIYEIGLAEDVCYNVTEFIDGATLRRRLTGGRINMPDALETMIQCASALTAAHAVGIVHRDIKPENIMVRPDGLVKVLDFGLAKLTGRKADNVDTEAPTTAGIRTAPGTVMGTAQYMSPEQARGFEVDARSDIWSLGVVLYEMLVGRVPFTGDTLNHVIVSILEHEPPPLARYGGDIPAELEWIVMKALRKDVNERYQTARELLTDLRQLKQRLEFEAKLARAGGPEAKSETTGRTSNEQKSVDTADRPVARAGEDSVAYPTTSAVNVVSAINRHRAGVLAAFLIVIAGGAFGLYQLIGPRRPLASDSFKKFRPTRLTNTGKAVDAVISPDGKFVVYETDDAGQRSLRVIQLATSSDGQIVQPSGSQFLGLTVSPDSNYVYYVMAESDKPVTAVYQAPLLSGNSRKLSGNLGTDIYHPSFSPDCKQLAFTRDNVEGPLLVINTDGTGERKLAARSLPYRFSAFEWSLDGQSLVCLVANIAEGYSHHLVELRLTDGKEKQISSQRWWTVSRLGWLRDGSGLLFTAADQPFGLRQVWQVSYPGGEARSITNGLSEYNRVSLTADSTSFVTVQNAQESHIWIVPEGDTSRARQITSGIGNQNLVKSWTPDGRIVYQRTYSHGIWIMNADGSNQKQLTANDDVYVGPSATADGRYIVFQAYRNGAFNVWRMEIDGGNQAQLSFDDGSFPKVTPDGKWVLYYTLSATGGAIWKVPLEGGRPVRLTDAKVDAIGPDASPDGKMILCQYSTPELRPDPGAVGYLPSVIHHYWRAILPFEGGAPIKIFSPGSSISGWMPDSRALTSNVTRNGVSNIWRVPLDGSPPTPLTDFKSEQIFATAWSRDGKQLACSRGAVTNDVVLISDLK